MLSNNILKFNFLSLKLNFKMANISDYNDDYE